MAMAGGSRNRWISPKATAGMMVNWSRVPMATFFGCRNTFRKSSGVRLMPMPNMMMPRKVGIWGARGFMSPGSRIPRNPMSTTPMDM